MAAAKKRRNRCRACKGTGYEACSRCGGTGNINVRKDRWRNRGYKSTPSDHDPAADVKSSVCPKCHGSGRGARCPIPDCVDGWRFN